MRTLLSWGFVSASLAFAQGASAEPLGSHQPHIEASLGVRVSQVTDKGFDPFADSDDLAQVSLGVGATLLRFNRLSLAGVGFWDYGQRSSNARGASTELDVHRLTIGPELRYHVLTPFYVFVHVLPVFARTQASLDDSTVQATRYARHWSYGADAAAGAAFEVYGMRSGESSRPRLWAIAEGGYGYVGSSRLVLKPESDSGAPQRTAAVDLGTVSLAGPYLRISAALSF